MIVEVGENRDLMYRERDYHEIKDDTCGIVKQVQDKDPDYFVLRRKRDGKLELHHRGQPDYTFCLMIPFEVLDDRTLAHIWNTRREKFKELMAAAQASNEKIERDDDNYMRDYVKWVGTETYRYVNTHFSRDTLDAGAFRTRFV